MTFLNACFYSLEYRQTHFLGNTGQEKVFYDIVERKNAFLSYKNKKFKKSKNWNFSKGVNPWLKIFHVLFSGNIGQENVFYDILEQKKHVSKL